MMKNEMSSLNYVRGFVGFQPFFRGARSRKFEERCFSETGCRSCAESPQRMYWSQGKLGLAIAFHWKMHASGLSRNLISLIDNFKQVVEFCKQREEKLSMYQLTLTLILLPSPFFGCRQTFLTCAFFFRLLKMKIVNLLR